MDPNCNIETIEENDQIDKPFCERPYEETEDGYFDDRGFYTTPNGSFWDEYHNYFNHLGFDRHGGSYDKYGVYHPGPEYDEKTGLYKEQKEFLSPIKIINTKEILEISLSKLKDQEIKDEKTMEKFEKPVEESEESDFDDKSNITYDENEIKEAYENIMSNENVKENIENVEEDKERNKP